MLKDNQKAGDLAEAYKIAWVQMTEDRAATHGQGERVVTICPFGFKMQHHP